MTPRSKAVERTTRGSENAAGIKQGRRAGTGTVRGREQRKGEETYIVPGWETAELLQQSSGVPAAFGKRRPICKQSNRGTSETQVIFL